MRARTGVGTPFPLRLLAQTPALWRGVIFEGCPTSEVWDSPYIIVYVYFGDRKLLRAGTPRRPAKVDKTLRGGMYRASIEFGSNSDDADDSDDWGDWGDWDDRDDRNDRDDWDDWDDWDD